MFHRIYKGYSVYLNGRYAGLVSALDAIDAERVFRETFKASRRIRARDSITAIAS
jgi:hypothetical protein